MRGTLEERFWDKVQQSEGCWAWTAHVGKNGYGQLGGGPRSAGILQAHRVSYELNRGPIPEGMFIDHICHNRGCVNPEHLRLATVKQNAENMGRLRADNKSGIRGVHWDKDNCNWRARLQHNGKGIHVGSYSTREEAEVAVIAKRLELFTHNDLDRQQQQGDSWSSGILKP